MGHVQDVERYLQALNVLRAAELPVPKDTLVARVTAYRSIENKESQLHKINFDLRKLAALGFVVDNLAPVGADARYVLRSGTWRVPVDLDDRERALLVWVMAAGGATAAEQQDGTDVSGLLGEMPRSIDVVQSALAGGRLLRIERFGDETTFAPGALACRRGTWFVLGTFAGESEVKGPRLDRLGVLGLGGPLPAPVDVPDPELVLDSTAWGSGPWREAEVCCLTADLHLVDSWFTRAEREDRSDGTSCLSFPFRNEAALLDRVLGLAGAAWFTAPAELVTAARERALQALAAIP